MREWCKRWESPQLANLEYIINTNNNEFCDPKTTFYTLVIPKFKTISSMCSITIKLFQIVLACEIYRQYLTVVNCECLKLMNFIKKNNVWRLEFD